jgi:transposase
MASDNTDTQHKLKSSNSLSNEARFFLEPDQPKQRQYEALRAYFVEELTAKDVADRFGYTPGAFHVLCHKFRKDPERKYFVETKRGPKYSPKRDRSRERVIALRKKNNSVQDMHLALREEGISLSPSSIWKILSEEGFAKLPRRRDEERPDWPRPEKAEYADIRQLSLAPRVIGTRFGGVFLLMRILL